MKREPIHYTPKRLLFSIVAMLLFACQLSAQSIVMPSIGDTTITINPNTDTTIYDPGGETGNYPPGTSTMTIKSSDGRPFVINGWFDIGSSHCLTIYNGESTRFPIEGMYFGTGNIKIYCYSGAVTFHFFRTPAGRRPGFELNVCFPEIYDVHADSTNSTYTHIAWNPGVYNSWYLDYFQTHDQNRSTQEEYISTNPYYSPQALASGTEYTYHIRPTSNWDGTYDTSDYCYAPPHKFRTPKVANCNTCGHNRNCIKYNDFYAEQVVCFKGNTWQPDSAECVSPSQHAVVTDTTGRDPRTGNQLTLVPDEDTASVRLGNPENGHGGESILYEIHVDTNDYDLMVLKYATVLRYLNTQLKHEKPRFTIRLFDENCLPIQPLCYCRDILDDENTTGWHTSTYTTGGNTDTYLWRDWTSMGIDIAPYHGKTIYLQLSTRDGSSTGSAYAYFTLHCARKQIDHLGQCSDNIANIFYAPEGFNYRWYNADRPDSTLSTTNSLAVTDSGLYQCWVYPLECFDESCGYSISALAVPRFPHADFDSIITTSSCSFNVRFINRSFIADANGNPLWTNEDCETAFWDFGNGQTSTNYNAEAVYTAAGTYTVRLIVGIAGGQCTDTITKQIQLRWAHQTPLLEGGTTFCPSPNNLELIMHNTIECRWEYSYYGQIWSDNNDTLTLEDITAQTIHCYAKDSNECNYDFNIPITILAQYNNTEIRTICQAQLENGWTWRGHTFSEGTYSDDYYFPDTTTNGCDSNMTLRLIVHETFHRYPIYTFCDYETQFPYPPNWATPLIVYDTIGEHTYTFRTTQGCDSIIHITMRIHVVDHDTIRDAICRGYSYDTLDFHYTSTENNIIGRRVVTHSATEWRGDPTQVQTCDSTMTLILDINPQTEGQRNYLINQNQLPFTFNGVAFNHAVNDTVFHLTNRFGCDSALHFTLQINFNTETHLYDTICDNALPYIWDGITFDSACNNIMTLTRYNGADSLIVRHLIVYPTYNDIILDTICDNESLTFCGVTYSLANSYTHNLNTIKGCDSTVTLMLTVNPTSANVVYDTTCNNIPYIFAGVVHDVEGIYSQILSNRYQCDSMVTLHLIIDSVTHSTFDTTILENDLDDFRFHGHSFSDETINQTIIIANQAGCDSIIGFSLHIIPNVSSEDTHIICQSELPHVWNGMTFTAAGMQNATLHTANGADSVVTMRLFVNPTYFVPVSRTICDNETTVFNGVSYNTTQVHIDTLTTTAGCDSITQLTLTVNPTHVSDFYDTTCNNQPYSFGDQTGCTEGDHIHVFQNVYSCDSTVTLHLHINNTTYSNVDEILVQNDLPHTFNGVTYTLTEMELFNESHSGTPYNDTITIVNTAGCDSIIYHTLTINWNQQTTVYQTICDNQFPVDWDGTLFVASDYTFGDTVIIKEVTLSNINGADSIVSRRLHINPTYSTFFRDTICDNATYSYNGNTYSTTGEYPNMLQSIAACDSLVTLQLTVKAVTYSDLYDTIVENQMPYSLNGVTYQFAETESIAPLMHYLRDTVTTANIKGCDSIIDMRLYIHLNVYDTVDSTICDNLLPMQWNARVFSDYVFGTRNYELNDTLTAWTGADSILTMRLHVNPTYDLHYYDTICSNQQVTFNNATYNLPGTYPHLLTSSLQCDSLETLHLTVYGTSAAIISDTILENRLRQTYSFNGVMFDTLLFDASTYITPRFSQIDSAIIIINQKGCDSTIHYTLNVHWNVNAASDSILCENLLPLQWNHRTFASYEPGIVNYEQLDTLVAHTGADSILTMRLHVDTNSSSYIPDTVLENALPHTFNGVTYTLEQMEALRDTTPGIQSGTLLLDTITIANDRSCDSVIHHALYIRWNKTTHIADTICENFFPYTWQGNTIAADSMQFATYNQPFTLIDTIVYSSSGGEDSIVVMHLYVKRNTISTLYDTIIENQMNYLWNGITFTWDDTTSEDIRHANLQHTGIISNTAGCDSIAAMNLMVWLNRTANADSNVCENNFPFRWNGILFDTTGSQRIMLMTTHGADSLLTMNVIELFNSTSTVTDTIVENQLAYTFNNAMFDHSHFGDTSLLHIPPSSMTYIDTAVIIINVAGCDSIINYQLNVWWNVTNGTDDTLCSQMLPHQWNSRIFTQDITDSSPMEGRWRVATLYDTLTAWSGADSLLAMHLHVMPSFFIDFSDTVCSSSYVAWYGDTIYETGVYPMAFNTVDGCDSIEYLHFANYPNYDFEYFDTICDYSGTMRLGVEYMGVAHLPTINGCDSNEVYHLWGMPVSYSNVDTIISEHQIPFAYNGEWFSDSGTTQQQFILTNQYGCDSVVNFTITVMPTVRQIFDSSICDVMMPLDWDGTVFNLIDGIGTYQLTDTLAGAYGADSIVTRIVHVSPSYAFTYFDTTCNGAPYHFGDSTYIETGVYVHTYRTTTIDPVFGVQCDSIETLHLQVNAMSYATQHDTIVENQLPYTYGGVTFSTTDEIIDSTIIILNTVACDSVITYSLFVYPNSYVNRDTVVCDNELPFQWDGRTVTHGGMDSVVIIMPDGTDSVTRYWTVVNPTYNDTDSVRLCDSYEWIDGNTYTESTIVNGFTLISADGCDSVKNLHLIIDHRVTTYDSIASCDPYTWIDGITYDASISGPTHLLQTIHGCDSTVVLEFTKYTHKFTELYDTICRGVSYLFGGKEYSETGVYTDSLQTSSECDSLVQLNLHVLEPPTLDFTRDHNCDSRIYTITAHCDVPYFEWSSFPDDPALTGHTHDRTIQVRPTTHMTYILFADYKDLLTCPNTISVNLSPLLKPHALIEYTPEFLTYDQLHLSAISRCTNEETRNWLVNDNDMGDQERISYLADPATDDSVVVVLTAHHGICHDTDMVVIPFRKATIWAPNAFTPEESTNNMFFIRYLGITDYRIDLYTRGGVLVWHSDDMNEGWDGTYKGKPCPQDAYVWIIHYRDVTAPKNLLSKKGTVTLLR